LAEGASREPSVALEWRLNWILVRTIDDPLLRVGGIAGERYDLRRSGFLIGQQGQIGLHRSGSQAIE
jgi:hypothetical protein